MQRPWGDRGRSSVRWLEVASLIHALSIPCSRGMTPHAEGAGLRHTLCFLFFPSLPWRMAQKFNLCCRRNISWQSWGVGEAFVNRHQVPEAETWSHRGVWRWLCFSVLGRRCVTTLDFHSGLFTCGLSHKFPLLKKEVLARSYEMSAVTSFNSINRIISFIIKILKTQKSLTFFYPSYIFWVFLLPLGQVAH